MNASRSHVEPGEPGPGPRPRMLLIGTPQTLRDAIVLTDSLTPTDPQPVGTLVVKAEELRETAMLPLLCLGTIDDLPDLHAQRPFDLALVCLPAVLSTVMTRVRGVLRDLGIPDRVLPTLHDLIRTRDAGLGAAPLGPTDYAALVGRAPRPLDHNAVRSAIAGRRVLITGAGGSIGSELARLCAGYSPSQLILMERSENALFEIDREIGRRFPAVPRAAVLHDVVDEPGTRERMSALRPDVVFHAAAHKHVPMMEDHPSAAVTNNLFGTRAIADASVAAGVSRFVMVSTDKAVNPTSVMGATKRLAELYVRSLEGRSATRFSIVRFGNVLGSACSVLPIWGQQLADGGPITVTHPEMTRFFMTIPEAASLVLRAGAIDQPAAQNGRGCPVYVLDMGAPVRILELAERFVRAHGLEPRVVWERPVIGLGRKPVDSPYHAVDPAEGPSRAKIVFTGIRPGEKLHEELSYSVESLQPTVAQGVMVWSGDALDGVEMARMIADLEDVRASTDADRVLAALARHLPELRRPDPNKSLPGPRADAA